MIKEKIKLVVAEEHTLGYILPSLPDKLQILHTSILRGSSWPYYGSVMLPKNYRLASKEDFDSYNMHFGSFGNEKEYEFQK